MTEPTLTPDQTSWLHQVVTGIGTAFMAVMAWLFKGAFRKVGNHGKRIAELERITITSDDMNQAITQFRTEIHPQIEQIQTNVTQIQSDVRMLVDNLLKRK